MGTLDPTGKGLRSLFFEMCWQKTPISPRKKTPPDFKKRPNHRGKFAISESWLRKWKLKLLKLQTSEILRHNFQTNLLPSSRNRHWRDGQYREAETTFSCDHHCRYCRCNVSSIIFSSCAQQHEDDDLPANKKSSADMPNMIDNHLYAETGTPHQSLEQRASTIFFWPESKLFWMGNFSSRRPIGSPCRSGQIEEK